MKQRLKEEFGGFQNDSDYTITKAYQACSQGIRFRLDRKKHIISTQCLFISKRGGLLKPSVITSEIDTTKKEFAILNHLLNKPFLIVKENDKTKAWDVINSEAGASATGQIKVTQNQDKRTVTYLAGPTELGKFEFKCPVQKSGFCSSAKPATLHNINIAGKFNNIQFEENPNADDCKEHLEVNAYFSGLNPDQHLFSALVALLNVMARELK